MSKSAEHAMKRDDLVRRAVLDWLDDITSADALTGGENLDLTSLVLGLGHRLNDALSEGNGDTATLCNALLLSNRGLLAYCEAKGWDGSTSEIAALLAKEANLV